MNNKDSLSKLKNFFRMDKNSSGSSREKTDADLLHELEVLIQPQVAAPQRCKTLKELCESDKISRLEDATIIRLWELTKDLITSIKPLEQRHITYRFYQKLVQCQYEDLSVIRPHFFRVIKENDNPEDVQCQLDLLKTLTDNGKNIKEIDDVIGEFILNRWLGKLQESKQVREILVMVHNIIVYNAAYLDPKIVDGIITYACLMCCTPDDIVLQCLDVLDAILCYTVLPNKMLADWVNALCRTVNREIYVQKSWDIMKKLLGTKMGHAALLYMCHLLNNSSSVNDDALLRGAVFYINMGLWGSTCSKANDLFKQSPTSVLQSFLLALKSQRVFVTYEVIIGIQRLIQVSGRDLSEPTWDVLCDILRTIADNIQCYENDGLPKDSVIQIAYHEALGKIEQLLHRKEVATDPQTIYSVIEYVCESRSEESIMHLMEYKATKITPTQTQWLSELNKFMNRFFNMQNYKIRDRSLQVLKRIMDNNRSAYEEEILESIVIPTFTNIAHEADAKIRTSVGDLLLKFVAQCDTKRSIELLDIIEKLLNRPFDRFIDENRIVLKNDDELSHISMIIDELIRVFLSKLYTLPTAHAIKIFSMLNTHLEKYYQKPMLLEASVPIRTSIFAWLLRIRANSNYYVGYLDDFKSNRIRFSHFLSIDMNELNFHQGNRQQQNQPPILTQQSSQETEAQTTISIKRSCKIIIDCLVSENDWSVMQLVLKGLPLILQNKALFRGVDMETLAAAIIGLVTKTQHSNNKPRIDTFVPTTHKPQLSDFQALVINTIAALIPYHQHLSGQIQNRMITCLRPGLLSLENTPRVCIQAFTVMLMEILELMLRQLAEILFDMSRMSTTLNVAVPVLEFLSTLSRLPSRLFANFTNTQYMYVFAISLPYTNPHKYDHYTVSLAHHVIAGWFLKCKLAWRKDFVLYILKGLTTNVQKPFEEMKRNDYAPINEDSSNRKRSSSLTERGAKQRGEQPSLQNLHIKRDEAADEVAYNFHMELADTCIDFLSRHTYSTCSALPKRSPTAEYLLTNNHSMSWLVGHNVVTITTSGCSSTAVRNGLCDRCILMCKSAKSTEPSSSNGATSPEVSSLKSSGSELCRRYTKATLQHNSGEVSESSEFSNSSSTMTTPFGINSDANKFFKSTSNEGRFNSSGSLDALSRRGSNPDTLDHSSETVSKHGSIGSHPMYLSPQQSIERIKQVCICACSGWAEIVIRRPTGNMSWIMKIQNHIALDSLSCDVPLQDLINMCTPSLGEIYNIQDLLNEEPIWNNVNITNVQLTAADATKKKSVTVETNTIKSAEMAEKKPELSQSSTANVTQKTDAVPVTTAAAESNASISHPLSGPINIPKSANNEKIPSGSFSDGEPEDDDGNGSGFDDNEAKSRNPVRRVNSSPEMSSNWRHPFIGQKSNQPQATGVNLSTHCSGDDEFSITDSDQQQKKKNLRPSCEAIPEEIGDATPPKTIQIDQQKSKVAGAAVSVVASGMAKNQHLDFIAKTNSAQNSSSSSSSSSATARVAQNSSVDSLMPLNQNAMPRKQHSADDALQQQDQAQSRQQPAMNEPRHSSSGSAINIGASASKSKLHIDMPNLATKPPQSHAPLSPRLLSRNNLEMSHLNSSANFNDFQRGRSKTISVVRGEHDNRDNSKWTFKGTRSVLSPNSIFLQLFYTGPNKVTEQPLLINPKNSRTIDMINYIPPFETHKIGVLYVGRGQNNNEIEILSNRYGSLRYMDFIQNLGALVSLKNAKDLNLFIDMETDGRDGNFTYIWQDDIIQVTFHVATLMPNKEDDPNRTEKKKNIGNDFVAIVYNESGEEYNLSTIKGQFNYACVIIEPLELNSNRIYVRCKDEVAKFICHTEPKIISDASAPGYARQLALHANLASLVAKSLQTKNARPYASNWLERLRRIKHLRAKILKENGASASTSNQAVNNNSKNERETEDFTQYT